MDVDVFSRNGWINPQGKFYSCEYYGNSPAHEISAKNILLDCYGISSPIPGDKLIKFGWIKVTTAAGMFHIYEKDGMYNRMTDEQVKTFEAWCNSYGIYTRNVYNKEPYEYCRDCGYKNTSNKLIKRCPYCGKKLDIIVPDKDDEGSENNDE